MTTTGPGSSGPSPDDGRETPIEPTEMADQAPAPAEEGPVAEEEPMASQPSAGGSPAREQTSSRWRRFAPWLVAGIAVLTALWLAVCNPMGGDSDGADSTQSAVTPSTTASAPMILQSYTIRVIDPEKVDYRKWRATIYAHDACSSKEIKEFAQKGGVIESRIPIEADGTIRVRLIPGNYAVGIGNASDSYGHLFVEVGEGNSEDRRFAYDPVSGSCAQDRRAPSVIVFSELPNAVVTLAPAPTQTPSVQPPAPTAAPPRTTVAPPAATARPLATFSFDADASPASGVSALASTITTRVTQASNVRNDVWLISVDCNRDGTFEYTNARTGRIGNFNCAYSTVGTHSWYARAVLEEDGSAVREDFGTVTVTAPTVVTTPTPTTTTDSIQFDLVPGRTSEAGPPGFQSRISATALNVRGPGVTGGYTVTYQFDCGSNASAGSSQQTSGAGAEHTCTFYGGSGSQPVVTVTVTVRSSSGSTATKTVTLQMIVT